MARPTLWLRVGLLVYLAVTALITVWAAGWPRGFYDDFPWPGHAWVASLPAYNEHLVRDFGGMNLAMAVVFGVAAATLDRRLAATALVAYLVFAVPHLAFHLQHLEPFAAADALARAVTLAAAALLPLPLLALARRASAPRPDAGHAAIADPTLSLPRKGSSKRTDTPGGAGRHDADAVEEDRIQMYATITKLQIKAEEQAVEAVEGLNELLAEVGGLAGRLQSRVVRSGPRELVMVTVYESEAAAAAAGDQMRPKLAQRIGPMVTGAPDRWSGPVVAASA
jgi:hypothetical protein